MRRRPTILLAIAAALVVTALVAGVALSNRSTIPHKSNEAASSLPAADRDPLPQFTGQLTGGGRLTDADIKTPAVIHFFASWCEICLSEAPAIARLQREHPDLNFYTVAVEDTPSDAVAFARRFGWEVGRMIDDPRRETQAQFSLVGQPHTVFVDDERTMVVHQGGASYGDLDVLAAAVS